MSERQLLANQARILRNQVRLLANQQKLDQVIQNQKEIKAKYHRIEKDSKNFGRIFVHFRW